MDSTLTHQSVMTNGKDGGFSAMHISELSLVIKIDGRHFITVPECHQYGACRIEHGVRGAIASAISVAKFKQKLCRKKGCISFLKQAF